MAENPDTKRLLEVENLELAYGAVQVVWDLSLKVSRGQIVSIIGPNCAGKTTTLRALAGLVPVRKGKIVFDGKNVTSEPAHERVRHHLCLIPEGRQLWPRMTVEENLLMGAFSPPLRAKADQNLARIYELFPRLKERSKQACGTLSGGDYFTGRSKRQPGVAGRSLRVRHGNRAHRHRGVERRIASQRPCPPGLPRSLRLTSERLLGSPADSHFTNVSPCGTACGKT